MKSVIDENCIFCTQPIALARSRGVIEEKRQSEKRKSNRTDSRRDRTHDGKKSLSFLVHGIPRESIKLSDETT